MSKVEAEEAYDKLIKYDNILTEIVRRYPSLAAREQLEKISMILAENCIPENEKKLLQLYGLDDLTQDELDPVISGVDIETLDAETVLLLSYMTKKFPHLSFGTLNAPRLKGLLQYYRFRNMEQLSHFSKTVRKMNENGIVPLILKGGAMKVLRPDLPRLMGPIDIVVPSQAQWKNCRTIAEDIGYTCSQEEHSINIYLTDQPEKGIAYIHKKIPLIDNELFITAIFDHATLRTINNAECLVPSYENLAFLIIINLSENLRNDMSLSGLPFTIVDLLFLTTREGFSWKKTLENVEKNKLEAEFYLAAGFADSIIPNLIPQNLIPENKLEESIRNYLNRELKRIRWRRSTAMKCYLYCEKKVYASPVLTSRTKAPAALDFVYKTARKMILH